MSGDARRVHLDHFSHALAWTHRIHKFSEPKLKNPKYQSGLTCTPLPWTLYDNPKPQRRIGFPFWSWAGWFGEIGLREDFHYCWTSYLSSVRINFRRDKPKYYARLRTYGELREDIFKAIQAADRKAPKARRGRIGLFERLEPDAIVCLVVRTVDGVGFGSKKKFYIKVDVRFLKEFATGDRVKRAWVYLQVGLAHTCDPQSAYMRMKVQTALGGYI
ncbi:hypothetical protein B0O99DRAFT_601098 [Bisporella sp. PMI_857]|nr:hypothetical protein B0O99DRAFT_601098 [Bisporella sp. PMI_857]